MTKRGLSTKKIGYGRNDLCHCNSGLKYEKCHGLHMKGTGTTKRIGIENKLKPDKGELINKTTDVLKWDAMKKVNAEVKQ